MVSVTIKNVRSLFRAAACLAALTFSVCEKVPENCGDGYPLNAETQFCFGGTTHDKCRGETYDPAVNKCDGGILKDKCGGNWYDPATEFCLGGTAHAKCGGLTYDPAVNKCDGGVLKNMCGDNNWYDPATGFCSGGEVTPIKHTLTVNASPAGSGTASSVAETETSFRIRAAANDGYEFVNWTTAANGGATLANANSAVTTVTLSSSAAVTANFRQTVAPPPSGTTYTLQVSRNPTAGGNVTVNGGPNNPAQSTHNAGASITLTATPNSGYTFQNWTAAALPQGVNAASASITFAINGNVNMRANFQQAPPCTLRVSRNIAARGNVSVTVAGFTTTNPTAALVYDAGTSVTITAAGTDSEYPFQNWGAVSGALPQGITATNATITFSISGNVNIQARFGLPAPVVTTFTDERDQKSYKQVTIGNQTWMAQNLNFDIPGITEDKCYDNADSNCVKYGRLYDWKTAMNDEKSSSANPSGVQGICPFGWHIPSDAEWTQLTDFVGGATDAGTKLKATTGWPNNGNGYDDYGFSALPGGGGYNSTGYVAHSGYWWSTTQSERMTGVANFWIMYDNDEKVGWQDYGIGKTGWMSVRCVAD